MKIALLFILSSSLVFTFSKLIPENLEAQEDILAQFAYRTYTIYCTQCKTTLLIRYENNHGCNQFLKYAATYGHTMPIFIYEISKNFQRSHEEGRASLTIAFLNTYRPEKFREEFRNIEKLPFYQSYSKFLLVFSKHPENYTAWLADTFKFLWSKRVLRIFITFWTGILKVYSYDPFSNECKDITNESDKVKNVYLEAELFNLKGYPMGVYLWDIDNYADRVQERNTNGHIYYIGYDGKPLTQVRNVLNVTLKIIRESETHNLIRHVEKNKVPIGSYRNAFDERFFQENNIDIHFTAARTNNETRMDTIFLHERDDYVIIVPKGEKLPEYLYIFLLLPFKFVFPALFSMFVVSVVLHLIRYTKKFPNNQYSVSVLDVWRIIFNIPLKRYNNDFHEKIVIWSWLFFSLIFSCAFNCTLFSTLVVPKYYPDINRIDELVQTNLSVWTTPFEYDLIKSTITTCDAKLLNKLRNAGNDSNFRNLSFSFPSDSGFLMRSERAREFMKFAKKKGRTG